MCVQFLCRFNIDYRHQITLNFYFYFSNEWWISICFKANESDSIQFSSDICIFSHLWHFLTFKFGQKTNTNQVQCRCITSMGLVSEPKTEFPRRNFVKRLCISTEHINELVHKQKQKFDSMKLLKATLYSTQENMN